MVPVVEMRNICKSFPGVTANDNVSLTVMPGEIHALLGENGAGKTTLMSILAGMVQPDSGEILWKGQRIRLRSPMQALKQGIGMIYQHFMLVPGFTVAENVAMGHPETPFWLNRRRLEEKVRQTAARFGFNLNPGQVVSQLSIGEQQRVEILRVLYRGAEVMILDEPTTVLTPHEVRELFGILQKMKAEGKAIILITHKLREVLEIADRVTVLRRGRVVGSLMASELSEGALAVMMVGKESEWSQETGRKPADGIALKIENLRVRGDHGNLAVKSVNLEVRKGEILAIAGVAGNGQREFLEALAGLREVDSGEIYLNGEPVTNISVRKMIELGIRMIPEDRIGVGLVGNLNLPENLILRDYNDARFGRGWALDYQAIKKWARELVRKFDIDVAALENPVKLMSGGNLQRLLLAREISQNPRVILAAYPTRGLDVAATEAIYHMLLSEREQGAAIILVMEDLDEIMRLADRVVVMYNGTLSPAYEAGQIDIEEIGRLMAGVMNQTREAS